MKKIIYLPMILFTLIITNLSLAQENPESFNKTNVYGGKWSSQLFADASVVEGPYKTVYIAGMAAEDPDTGKIQHKDDFYAQCKMAYGKIRKILKNQGGDMSNIVRTVSYLTDMRYAADYVKCQKEALDGASIPTNTMLSVSQLAWPGMMVEVEVTAAIPYKK